jgi:phage baseplate assembly protein W
MSAVLGGNGNSLQRFDRLGQGWGQPIAPDDASGRLPVVAGPEKVRQAIFTLLDTEPGERVMRPDFGCGLRRYLMAPNTPGTRAGIEQEITQTLGRWEPRIKVVAIAVTPAEDRATVVIEIHYAHVLDGRQDVLVYPFALEPA